MKNDEKKLRELEKEFRDTVVDELKVIKLSQTNLKSSVDELDKKIDLNIQKIEFEIENIKTLDIFQNGMLEEHMRRSVALEELHRSLEKQYDARMKLLEAPRSAISLLEKWILRLGGIVAAGYAVLKAFGKV